MAPTEPLPSTPLERNQRGARPMVAAGRAAAEHGLARPAFFRALGRSALAWAAAWGVVIGGVSATIKGSGDVIGLDAFWPLVAVLAAGGGALSGAVYGLLRRLVPFPVAWRRAAPDQRVGVAGRLAAAGYGAATVGGVLIVTGEAIFSVSGAVLGACTAFVLPGTADL